MGIDDKSLDVTKISLVCWNCKHLRDAYYKTRSCDVFVLIPLEIWEGTVEHIKPYLNDICDKYEEYKPEQWHYERLSAFIANKTYANPQA